MAIHAHNTPASAVQPQALLRPVPEGPPLLPAAICSTAKQMQTVRHGGAPIPAAIGSDLSAARGLVPPNDTPLPPAPLPSLTAAFSPGAGRSSGPSRLQACWRAPQPSR